MKRIRPFSTSRSLSASAHGSSNSKQHSIMKSVYTILQTQSILPIDEPWSRRLNNALETNQNRVTVIGDSKSGVMEFITINFDNALSSNDQLSALIENRRSENSEVVKIQFNETNQKTEEGIEVQSNWLKEEKLEIVEIVHGNSGPLESSVDIIYNSDVILLHLDEIRLLTDQLKLLLSEFHENPNLLLVLNSETEFSQLIKNLESQLDNIQTKKLPIKVINTQLGLQAINSLKSNNSSSTDPNEFSNLYQKSKINELKLSINELLHSKSTKFQSNQFLLNRIIAILEFQLIKLSDSLRIAKGEIAELQLTISTTRASTLSLLEITNNTMALPPTSSTLTIALKNLFSKNLNFYQLFYALDDLPLLLKNTLQSSFYPTLPQSLLYKTLQLQSLQQSLQKSTDHLFTTPSFSPPSVTSSPLVSLYSEVNKNNYQKSIIPSTTLIPSTVLLAPLEKRLEQFSIPGGPIMELQKKGQKLLRDFSITSISSLSYLLFAESITASLGLGVEGFGIAGYEALATLIGVGGIYKFQSSWEKAKRKFVENEVKRIEAGLGEDLGILGRKLEERMVFCSEGVVLESLKLLEKKERVLEGVRKEVEGLRREME